MNKFYLKNKISGYSIVEIIVYLAIFSILSVLVINSFIRVLSSFNNTAVNRKLLESGTVAMERMTREIRQAQSIDASSTLADPFLVLKTSSGYVCFNKTVGGNLDFSSGATTSCGTIQGDLLDDHVFLTRMIFRPITTTESRAVKIEMTLEYREGDVTRSENFYDTVVLRGSY